MCKQACVQRIRGWFLESREQRGCQNEFRPSAVGRPPCEEVNLWPREYLYQGIWNYSDSSVVFFYSKDGAKWKQNPMNQTFGQERISFHVR